ncbi:MAG: hypothetical protein LBH25_01755, partial [Fibromonadaceae bacterium]|nr:hypothetical protein [Fibromonadaceae bacterium]
RRQENLCRRICKTQEEKVTGIKQIRIGIINKKKKNCPKRGRKTMKEKRQDLRSRKNRGKKTIGALPATPLQQP